MEVIVVGCRVDESPEVLQSFIRHREGDEMGLVAVLFLESLEVYAVV